MCFYKAFTYLYPGLLVETALHVVENSTHTAPFLRGLQGLYEGAELSKQETQGQKGGAFSSVTPEPQIPGIPEP